VEERPTGELQLSAGFSSLESFIFQGSIRQNNFRGRGQTIGLSVDYSRFTRSVQVSFTEPYLFDKNVSLGVDVYRRDLNSFNQFNSNRNTTYKQATTGFSARVGVPLSEYMSLIGRYTFNLDDVTLDRNTFYINGQCSILLAGRYLCDAIGKRTSSILGASLVYDTLDNRLRPSRGTQFVLGADVAGLGGSVRYARITANAAKFWPVGGGFIFSVRGEGGAIKALSSRSNDPTIDDVRLTDRFFLGEPQIRGFDIRGVGPRVLRKFVADDGSISADRNQWVDDALGGKYYYLTRAELEIPLGSGARELGLRPSIYVDAGAVWGITNPLTVNPNNVTYYTSKTTGAISDVTGLTPDQIAAGFNRVRYVEEYVGDTMSPRVSVGIGVNWNSPFGPFRLDFAKVLKKANGDDPKTFTFNVGTQF
ncbi:MAG: BamA/TamA family outer membrane protein, partial [Novosphingobium sp.]